MTHRLHDWDGNVKSLVIFSAGATVGVGRNNCSDPSLCSHICVPTPAGSVRCLCPDGYLALPDSKNCILPQPTSTEDTAKWKTMLAGASLVGVILMFVIILGSLKYHQTRVCTAYKSVSRIKNAFS